MEQSEIKELIGQTVTSMVSEAQLSVKYRRPLVGYADAHDPRFKELKSLVPIHCMPDEVLPGAKTVVSMFYPFDEDLMRVCRQHEMVPDEWALAYRDTNELMRRVCTALVEKLEALGIKSAWDSPLFGPMPAGTLQFYWSHKSIAHIAGLGEFGKHTLLITPMGCAGRIMSLVIDVGLTPSESLGKKLRLPCNEGCTVCMEMCPAHAITEEGFDRFACYKHIDKLYATFRMKFGRLIHVCSRCSVWTCSTSVPGSEDALAGY